MIEFFAVAPFVLLIGILAGWLLNDRYHAHRVEVLPPLPTPPPASMAIRRPNPSHLLELEPQPLYRNLPGTPRLPVVDVDLVERPEPTSIETWAADHMERRAARRGPAGQAVEV